MKKVLVSLLVVLLFAACGSKEDVKEETAVNEQEVLLTQIVRLDSVIRSDFSNKEKEAALLFATYVDYINQYPADEKTAEFVVKSAHLAEGIARTTKLDKRYFSKAIELYQLGASKYSDKLDVAEMIYFEASILDLDLDKRELAKPIYQKIVAEYPETLYAEQAAARLETIDLSLEELAEKFMQDNAKSSGDSLE